MCVAERETWSREGRQTDTQTDGHTDRQEETEGRIDKETEQRGSELIYRFTRVHQ